MYHFTCPTCHAVQTVARREEAVHRPFCCARCKLIDLGRWFGEVYRVSDPIGDQPVDDDEGDTETDSPDAQRFPFS